MVGDGGLALTLMGPAAEMDKMRPACDPLGAKYYSIDGQNGTWR